TAPQVVRLEGALVGSARVGVRFGSAAARARACRGSAGVGWVGLVGVQEEVGAVGLAGSVAVVEVGLFVVAARGFELEVFDRRALRHFVFGGVVGLQVVAPAATGH